MKTSKEIQIEIDEAKYPLYIYVLCDPDGKPFYVGKGGYKRIFEHEQEAKNEKEWRGKNYIKIAKIRKIWKEGGKVQYYIDSWHLTAESAHDREIELITFHGRRCNGTGILTNITKGGEGCLDLPEEIKEKISQNMANYCKDNPQFIQNLQNGKNEWIKNNPEEYQDAEKKRLEICQKPEVREAVSKTLKQMYKDNPELLQQLSDRAKQYYKDHPEALERMSETSKNNNSHENIIRWLETAGEEVLQEKWAKHAEWLKGWHQTEEGKLKTKQAAEKRNKKFRTQEHRSHMAEKTRKYNAEHPEEHKARRAKALQWIKGIMITQICFYVDIENI